MTATLLIHQPDHSRSRPGFIVANPLQHSLGDRPRLTLELVWWIDHNQPASVKPIWNGRVPEIKLHRDDVPDAGRRQCRMKHSHRRHLLDRLPSREHPMTEPAMTATETIREREELVP